MIEYMLGSMKYWTVNSNLKWSMYLDGKVIASCCGGNNNVRWNAGKAQWECKDCGAVPSNDPTYLGEYMPRRELDDLYPSQSVKCECGATKVGSDRHIHYCPLYKP